jgi:multidrug efflux system membrane fusion protein
MTETEASTQETGSSDEPNPTPFAALLRHWKIGLLAVCLLAIGVYIFWTKSGEGRSRAAVQGATASVPAVPVATVAAKTGSIPVYLTGLGSVTPLNTVTVKTQVNGQLISVRYQEGQLVRVGDLLAEIDPRPLQAQLTQFEGQLVRDQALLDNARLDLKRFTVLVQQNSIPRQQYDTQVSLVHQLEGTVKSDQGQIEGVKVQLIYCRITAPVSGRLGLRQVDLGNIVRAGDVNGLVVITQLQPITVVFSIPEDNLPPVMKKLQAGEKLPVTAYDRAGKTQLAVGVLLTVDNQIDPATGTVKLKAQFVNEDLALFPNQFVNVRMLVDTKQGATVIPAAAVQRGTPGTFVYTVDAETKAVSVRKVTLGPVQGDMISVEQGLKPGMLVVVDGADKLREGAVVEMVVRDNTPPKERRKRGDKGVEKAGEKSDKGGTPEERAKRWQETNARIDKGEFGEEIKKLSEEERKQRMRELRSKKSQ